MRSLLSIGRGMGLYLDIAQVDSKGSPRRLFLCNMIKSKIYCLWYLLLLLYEVGYVTEHLTGLFCFMRCWLLILHVTWSNTLLMVSYLIKLVVWGCGASHDHWTRGLGMWSLTSVFYFMCIWCFEYELLTLFYKF